MSSKTVFLRFPLFCILVLSLSLPLGLHFGLHLGSLRHIAHWDFVAEACTRLQTEIPGKWTNGAVIDFLGERWVFLRKMAGKQSFIGVATEQDAQLKEIQLLDLDTPFAEDPRVLEWNGGVALIYNTLVEGNRRMQLAFLTCVHGKWQVQWKEPLVKEGMQNTEKNWVPFTHKEALYFIYQSDPWTVLSYTPGGYCKIITQEKGIPGLSGGTPAIRQGDEYVSFFHIRSGKTRSYFSWNRYVYLMGAYTFSADPPFHLKRKTIHPLTYKGAYNWVDNWSKILYPVGCLDQDAHYLVSIGINDNATGYLQVPKATLEELLVPHL